MSQTHTKYPLHRLPLPPTTLQKSLPQLPLSDSPSSQRRSTTFPTSTPGIWARVNPLWTSWPLRITKEEALELGVDVEKGQQISVEDVLRRWDPVDQDEESTAVKENNDNGIQVRSSNHRLKVDPVLLGLSEGALRDSLPHLDVGDALSICKHTSSTKSTTTEEEKVNRESLIDILSGRKVLSSADGSYGPWSTRYVGHQFGSWAGQLGDGRAISLFETISEKGGRQEIQLKGAGRTPFSRTADGLAVLRSGVREYLGCEAIAALSIPTTRSLALLTTPLPTLPVIRENGPEPSSLLCRLAPTFIRIGHFQALNPGKDGRNSRQFFLGGRGWLDDQSDGDAEKQGNLESLQKLIQWVKEVMEFKGSTKEWFEEVVKRNAETVAGWQVYGWMHGVLNTDNISPLGLTIDYGPYAFMDVFDNNHICNHSDPSGLYSYRAQPGRVLFALDKLATALAPIIGLESSSSTLETGLNDVDNNQVEEWEEKGLEVLGGWDERYWSIEREAERKGWLKRFGLKTYVQGDDRLIADYLRLLSTHKLDFHTSFRILSSFSPSQANSDSDLAEYTRSFVKKCSTDLPSEAMERATQELQGWLGRYGERASLQAEKSAWSNVGEWGENREKGMNDVNPRFILRQWVLEELIGKMEESLTKPFIDAQQSNFNSQASEENEDGEMEVDQMKIDQGVDRARRELAKILDMSVRPFEPWGEGEMPSHIESGSAEDQANWLEERRLCGLGKKEMLGFQCSCSS